MKKISITIILFLTVISLLSFISCGSNSKKTKKEIISEASSGSNISNAEKEKICGTWEVCTMKTYDKTDHKELYSESQFDENLKWKLIITDDGKITKPADNEFDDEVKATYKLFTGSEALEKGIIEKKHQRRAANSGDDMILLFADKKIIGERLFQIVDFTNDTLILRFLSSDRMMDEHIFEYKLVKK